MTDIDQRISAIEKVVNDDIGEGYEYSNLTVEDAVWLISQLREQRRLCDHYREALEFYADEDTYGQDMAGDGTPIPGSVVVLNDRGYIADLALQGDSNE